MIMKEKVAGTTVLLGPLSVPIAAAENWTVGEIQ